ncbi:MAG: spore coat protein CotJB [Clostridiales bacterium]|jgi:spore coat protein JB|nr:spore coat protein CotJB [Clostridiales bacterium]
MDQTLLKLTQLDFCAADLQLYLDTHPDDAAALTEYNKLISDAANLRAEYEKAHGSLTSRHAFLNGKFSWIDEPWSWENGLN